MVTRVSLRQKSSIRSACALLVACLALVQGTAARARAPQAQAPPTQAAPAQASPAQGSQTQAPVFKAGVDLVAIDVSVVDKAGTPLRSLTADQFTVTVDGRPRRVLSAELVDYLRQREGSERDDTGEADSGQAFSSNEKPWRPSRSGRLFYLLVDQASFRPGAANAVIAATRRFVQALQAGDRVGLVAFPGPGPSIAATADHAAVRIALSSLVGTNLPIRSVNSMGLSLSEAADIDASDTNAFTTIVRRECGNLRGVLLSSCSERVREEARGVALDAGVQTRSALGDMSQILQALAVVEERKTIVLVSGGLPSSDRSTGTFNLPVEIAEVAREATRANANVYVLHLDTAFLDAFSSNERQLSRTVGRDSTISGGGLDTLAGASGGTLLRVTSEASLALDRVLRETSASYVLGLEPLDRDQDGKPHQVRVDVKVPGAQVRARREFIVSPIVRTASASPIAVALAAPRVANGLSLAVSTRTVSADPAGGLRVLLSAEVGQDVPGAGAFTTALVVKDMGGRVVAGGRPENSRLVVPRGSRRGSAAYVATLALPPGDYRLRLAATDAEGRVGSVDHHFSVALAEGDGVMMGDLVLLHPARTLEEPVSIINDGRMPVGKVAAHLEVIPTGAGAAPTVRFAIADRVGGQLLLETPGILSAGTVTGGSAADAVLDLALLPPGQYTAVATVSNGTRKVGTRFQPLYLDRPAAGADAGVPGSVATSGAAPRVRFAPGSTKLVREFTRDEVLTPPALAYFASRLVQADAAPPPPVALALAELRGGRFDAALGGLDGAPSDGLSAAFVKGVALLARGQAAPAAVEFKRAIAIQDDFLPAAFYLGACYASMGRDEMAVGAWQTALATEGEARIVYDVLADALLRLGEAGQTLQVLDEAKGRWPADEGFLPREAVAQAMLGRRADSFATLQRYLDGRRTDAEALALAIRLIYEARAAGQTITSASADREAAARYGEWYHAAGGQNAALVDRWLAFIAKQ
jgi:VWFA-related protein